MKLETTENSAPGYVTKISLLTHGLFPHFWHFEVWNSLFSLVTQFLVSVQNGLALLSDRHFIC